MSEPTEQQEPSTDAGSGTGRLGVVTVFRGVDDRTWARFRRSSSFGLVVGGVVTVVIAGIVAGVGFSGGDDPAEPSAGDAAPSVLVTPVTGPADPGTAPFPSVSGSASAPVVTTEPGSVGGPGPDAGPGGGAAGPDPDAIIKAGPPAAPRTTAAAQPATTKAAPAPTTVKPEAAKTLTYFAIAGLGCDAPTTSYSRHGWFKAGNAGWWTLAQGSTREGGCTGEFDDMPMSGHATAADADQAMVFGFRVGSAHQKCVLDLYIPSSPSPRDVVAKPAYLKILSGTALGSPVYSSPSGHRTVSQQEKHNNWVSLGIFPVSNGALGVKITNPGVPANYPVTYPHVAGGAVRARCVAA